MRFVKYIANGYIKEQDDRIREKILKVLEFLLLHYKFLLRKWA